MMRRGKEKWSGFSPCQAPLDDVLMLLVMFVDVAAMVTCLLLPLLLLLFGFFFEWLDVEKWRGS